MDKMFVIVYRWFALSDDNMLYHVTYCGDNSNTSVKPIHEGCVSNTKVLRNYLFYDDKSSSKLSVINLRCEIFDLHKMSFNDLHVLKHIIAQTCARHNNFKQIQISIVSHIINDVLTIQVTFPEQTRTKNNVYRKHCRFYIRR
jgi:hypothetical protein